MFREEWTRIVDTGISITYIGKCRKANTSLRSLHLINDYSNCLGKVILVNIVSIKGLLGDFPGGPVAKAPCSQCRGPGFDLWSGTRSHMPQLKILHATVEVEDPTCHN